MKVIETESPVDAAAGRRVSVPERIVEIVSDSGEGAQKAGQTFGTVCAKSHNGVWTVEIIPAEIKPPARSRAGASGIRVRFASREVTNRGERAHLAVAFNEQVLYGRIADDAYGPGTVVLLESKWAEDPQPEIRAQYRAAVEDFRAQGLDVLELPMEKACLEVVPDARVGKNMFVVGMLCEIFGRDIEKALGEVVEVLGKKGAEVVATNQELVRRGWVFAAEHVPALLDRAGARVAAAAAGDERQPGARARASSPPAWSWSRCTRSRRRPRSRTTWDGASPRSAASCTRPRTRSPRSASRSARATPARPPAPSPRVPAWRSRPSSSASPRWPRSRWW